MKRTLSQTGPVMTCCATLQRVYKHNLIGPHITNVTHCGRAPTSEQILCVALGFLQMGGFVHCRQCRTY